MVDVNATNQKLAARAIVLSFAGGLIVKSQSLGCIVHFQVIAQKLAILKILTNNTNYM